MKKELLKKMFAGFLAAAMCITSLSMGGSGTVFAASDQTKKEVEDILPFYNVDCGDFNVATPPGDEDFGKYQSVTEQVYGVDEETGKSWGIVDNYEATPPSGNTAGSKTGGVDTNWTWPQENGGWNENSPKASTNRYTKNQFEQSGSFGNTRKLDYKFELEPGSYQVKMLFADPWNCSKNPVVTLNKGKKSEITKNVTPGQEIAMDITTTAADNNELTVNITGTGESTKAINICYIMITDAAYKGFYENYIAATVDSRVTKDFNLPQGTNDFEILWSSDNEAVTINGSQAVVTRGDQDQPVTLTARIQNNEYYVEKQIDTIVRAENTDGSVIAIKNFNNQDVELLDDYYRNSYNKEVAYLVSLDTDRLLAGFRETAAYAAGYNAAKRTELMRNKKRYDGWENTKIGGHTLGHYMSAIAQAYVNPQATEQQKADLFQKITECVQGLKECQEMTVGGRWCKEGYLFGATITGNETNNSNLEYQFDRVTSNDCTNVWVPWYTMHKILAGLVDCHKFAGAEDALDVAVNLGMWTYNRVGSWSDSQKQSVLNIEYGGMNDVLYDLYEQMEGNPVYADKMAKILTAAGKFDEISLFETVKRGGTNILNNKHANTTIPKFIGALKRYIVLGEDESAYLEYAEKFWDMVIDNHTYITGGNSENEHFGPDNILYGEETTVNNETCNTYNMLKFTRELFKITGDSKYSDYYENTLINAIMSSQNPETGMSMYFQPMATGYQKVFGKATTDFWCCTGSGMENFGKLNDSVYFRTNNTLIVNMYISSQVQWKEKNVKVTQTSGISDISSESAEFEITSLNGNAANVNLAFRIPDWTADENGLMTIEVNGTKVTPQFYDFEGNEDYADAAAQEAYAYVSVKSGDKVKVTIPMETVAYDLPDNENAYAFKYGPVVLSAKLGNDPSKQKEASHGVQVRRASVKAVNSDNISIYAADSVEEYMDNINENLVRGAGNSFRLKGASFNYEFVPHYSQYTDNYGIYWVYGIGSRAPEDVINEKDTNRKDRVTIDSVQAGYGQYEPGVDTSTGNTGSSSEHTRYANAGGYFTYEMKVDKSVKNYLLLTLRKADNGKPMHVSVVNKDGSNGTAVYDTDSADSNSADAIQGMLSDSEFGDYYQVRVEIPEQAMKKAYKNADGEDVIFVKFEGTADKASAALYNWSYAVRSYKTANSLKKLSINGTRVADSNGAFRFWLDDASVDSVKINAVIEDTAGYVAIDGSAIEDGTDVRLPLKGFSADYEIKVFAEDFECVETYTLHIGVDTSHKEYANHIVKRYSFDETLGDAYPAAKATVPSKVEKTLTYGDGAKADTGKAVYLDGNNGLALGDAASLGESYTVSYWMKPDAILGGNDPTFCAGVFNPEYWLSLTHDGKIWSRYQTSAGKDSDYISTTASSAYKANEWQYVTLAVDGEKAGTAENTVTGTLYVNGNAVARGNVARGIMTYANSRLYFGVNRWDKYYKGYLDELIMMDTALSGFEVKEFYNGSINGSGEILEQETPVDNTIAMINAIGDVSYSDDSKIKIEAARAAYNKLTDAQKKQVPADVVALLTAAEKTYEDKKQEARIKLSACKITLSATQYYNGKAKTPAVKITYDGKTLKKNTDYKVSYKNNKNIGKATVTITGLENYTGTVTKYFNIKVKKNASYTVGSCKYKITNAAVNGKGTVAVTGVKSKKIKTVNIGSTVNIGGKKFKITAINANAFKSCSKLTKATIGANVTTIGKNAFYGCKKLISVTIKGKTLKKVDKSAFKKTNKKLKVKVPKAKKKAYKKLFKTVKVY